ncbi:hypothetical protein KAFR_0A07970 [Kazachstania africana CBS 2517]|uniref:Elongin-A n=1 Tax=Kazachstania africana (strain ATCC 22294 / BCRC 22015 / CBS 2517 / CECT 1963 / NBRC 1671 / NRRL Y-8276) TaxID=1071382 RepID=H2APD1_KAZAF|nr:hypothetical protein KAFR_0A07970 [Kazachstania africana CBS 2517]CCF56231.1 hypothetical protein KAFR_0A07970 [Kazachstania africana CBS 2517]
MKSLKEICELAVLQNSRMLDDINNVPMYLILPLLSKIRNMKVEQVVKLERSNFGLIFESDFIWLHLLRVEFPNNIDHGFISNNDIISNYYTKFFQTDYLYDLNEFEKEYIERCIIEKLKKNPQKNKYELPPRMLYFKYENDTRKREERSAERLRMNVQEIAKEREKKQTVIVDAPFLLTNKKRGMGIWGNNRKRLSSYFHNKQNIKRQVSRVAFGGSAGRPIKEPPKSESTQLPAPLPPPVEIIRTPPDHLHTTKPVRPILKRKRPSNSNNIFLNTSTITTVSPTKRKPSLSPSPKAQPTQPSSRHNEPSQNCHKRKSLESYLKEKQFPKTGDPA